MKEKSKFYIELKKAKDDEVALICVINKIMPLINKYSRTYKDEIDEDLRSTLIEYAIKLVKSDDFADKLEGDKKN